MKRWKEDLRGIGTLDYIVFKNVPMRDSKWGPIVELNAQIMSDLATRAVIEKGLPIRGLEVNFLRKSLGLTMQEFSKKMGLTMGAVQKWEKAATVRLHPVNEVAVRTLVAEEFDIEIPGKFSRLVGIEKTPKTVELSA